MYVSVLTGTLRDPVRVDDTHPCVISEKAVWTEYDLNRKLSSRLPSYDNSPGIYQGSTDS